MVRLLTDSLRIHGFETSADLVKKRQKSLRVEEFRINVRLHTYMLLY